MKKRYGKKIYFQLKISLNKLESLTTINKELTEKKYFEQKHILHFILFKNLSEFCLNHMIPTSVHGAAFGDNK